MVTHTRAQPLHRNLNIYICDRIWENPPYGIRARLAQCAFLVAQVEICQSPDFVIYMSNNPSSNCCRLLRRVMYRQWRILRNIALRPKGKILRQCFPLDLKGRFYATLAVLYIRPYKITYLILIHLFSKNRGGRRHFIFIFYSTGH